MKTHLINGSAKYRSLNILHILCSPYIQRLMGLVFIIVLFIILQSSTIPKINLRFGNQDKRNVINDNEIITMYNNDPTRVHGSINKSINRSNFRADSKNQHTMINKQQLALHQNEQKVTHPSNKRSKLNASDILSTITTENEKQYIINNHLYLNDNPDFVIILIQIHDRLEYVKHLINSLANVRDISEVLLIASHDVYDDNINEAVRSITFCRVMQIFYPFSLETHENIFPGEDAGDCPPNMNVEEARLAQCRYLGQQRFANKTQLKHHWWWKLNRVFDELHITRNHTGLVLLLEEDNYVAEDALHMLKLLQRRAIMSCSKCEFFGLGGKQNTINNYKNTQSAGAKVSMWDDNLGFAFNRNTWHRIANCAEDFCTHNDYNWDFSLQFVNQHCLEKTKKFYQIYLARPRVFHIGVCGFHVHQLNCNPRALLKKIQRELKTAHEKNETFPEDVTILQEEPFQFRLLHGWGGWDDNRDHELCINMTVIYH